MEEPARNASVERDLEKMGNDNDNDNSNNSNKNGSSNNSNNNNSNGNVNDHHQDEWTNTFGSVSRLVEAFRQGGVVALFCLTLPGLIFFLGWYYLLSLALSLVLSSLF